MEIVDKFFTGKNLSQFYEVYWFDKKRQILLVEDEYVGVDHYLYVTKKGDIIGLLSKPMYLGIGMGYHMTEAERNSLLKWAYKNVISYLNRRKGEKK